MKNRGDYLKKCFVEGTAPIGITYNELERILLEFIKFQYDNLVEHKKNFLNGQEVVDEYLKEFVKTITVKESE